jgi:hypothetical protein
VFVSGKFFQPTVINVDAVRAYPHYGQLKFLILIRILDVQKHSCLIRVMVKSLKFTALICGMDKLKLTGQDLV